MPAYYNENDPHTVAWLRELIKSGLITDGVVDDRSILEVEPSDLKGFTRHHFFAGIAGWELALQLANWPVRAPVCTASLPCQSFSFAGSQKGKEDERHLLPNFIELVKRCDFRTIIGEQVPAAIKHGWLDDLQAEMGLQGYTVGACVLTAAGAGAPHIRQRLFWVADSTGKRRCSGGSLEERVGAKPRGSSETSRMGDAHGDGLQTRCETSTTSRFRYTTDATSWSNLEWLLGRNNKLYAVKPSSIWMVDGISRRMVQCGDNGITHIEVAKKEVKNAKKTNTNDREILQTLQLENGEEKIPKHNRRYDSLYENGNITEQPQAIKKRSKSELRGVWKNMHTTCTSCGRESFEQLTFEFDDVMFKMPQGNTLAKFLGTDGAEYMQTLRQACDENRPLLDSQYSTKEVWESLNDEEKDRIRVHFNNRIWVFTEGLKPLVNGLPKGVVRSCDQIDADNAPEAGMIRLKGYGNAICPQTAAQFITAYRFAVATE